MTDENESPEGCKEPVETDRQRVVPRPVAGKERLTPVDTLRGFAVLGILVMNIYAYGLPHMAYSNPTVIGGFTGLDRLTWWINYLFFNFKLMPIFAMLFGAGLVLMYERFIPKGISFGRFWYRRILWLVLIGAVQGYLLWVGDILFLYSICGLFLYFFRKKSVKKLFMAAAIFYVIGFLPGLAGGYYFGRVRDELLPRIEHKIEAGEELTIKEKAHQERWNEMKKHYDPSTEELEKNIEIYRNGYFGIVRHRAPLYFMTTTAMLVIGSFWPTMGLMLAGMALMRLGVFSASRSKRFYMILAVTGYGAGLPLAYLSARGMIAHDFSFVDLYRIDSPLNQVGGPLVALGHIGFVMLACRTGILSGVRKRFSAAGRMALSNYIGQTLICTTVFYGYGLGLYASIGKVGLMPIVIGVWVVELIVSPLWLGRFRFGPLEWLWRTLTYGSRQPMRKKTSI